LKYARSPRPPLRNPLEVPQEVLRAGDRRRRQSRRYLHLLAGSSPQICTHLDFVEAHLDEREWFVGVRISAADVQMCASVEAAREQFDPPVVERPRANPLENLIELLGVEDCP